MSFSECGSVIHLHYRKLTAGSHEITQLKKENPTTFTKERLTKVPLIIKPTRYIDVKKVGISWLYIIFPF